MLFLPVRMFWHRLRRPFHSIHLDGRAALPMELWNYIFLHLDDDTLFVVAAVCRPFTELSIRIALISNGVTPPDLITGDITIPSCLLLHLHRGARFLPPIRNLSCVFEKTNLALHLGLLHKVVGWLENLQLNSVDLGFPSVPRGGKGKMDRLLDSSQHHLFYKIVRDMVRPTWRDVMLITERNSLRCYSFDVFTYLVSDEIKVPKHLAQSSQDTFPVEKITSLNLYFHRERSYTLRPFTMLVVNGSTMERPLRSLTLGYSRAYGHKDKSRLSSTQLSAMLPKLTLPHLRTLTVITSRIKPRALGDFLARHPQIEYLRDMRLPAPSELGLFIQSPPVSHSFQKVEAATIKNLLALLTATASSLPRTICVPFTKKEVPAHPALFQYLSQRNIPTELELSIPAYKHRRVRKFAEADFELAKTLHCVDAVSVLCLTFTHAATILPWLGALPALSETVFIAKYYLDMDLRELLPLARASLPGINIRVGRWVDAHAPRLH
ncbi:hypothetical protein MSAN_00605900 [Mycena sanguinolenta]|uniref:F-box domain-containing protein n=1 Tax=Mycena sanguinolenta TaxID=230812 RepID=A0A8H6Z7G0_9AGAR|nr:hypothetical protein MSAN_00605900 [Mycena sanguinolenta]